MFKWFSLNRHQSVEHNSRVEIFIQTIAYQAGQKSKKELPTFGGHMLAKHCRENLEKIVYPWLKSKMNDEDTSWPGKRFYFSRFSVPCLSTLRRVVKA